MMLHHYLLSAFRNVRRRAGHSFLNLFGLTVGLAAGLTIFIFVTHERSYDAHHAKAEQTYRINYIIEELKGTDYFEATPDALARAIPGAVSGVAQVAQMQVSFRDNAVHLRNQYFRVPALAYVEPAFFEVFTYPLVAGSAATLSDPNNIVLAESLARTYFGEEQALGQTIRLNDRFDLNVVGVMADPPSNTHLPFPFFVSLATLQKAFDQWTFSDGNVTYLVLEPGSAPAEVERSLNTLRLRHQPADYAEKTSFELLAVRDLHTDMRYSAYPGSFNINPMYLWSLALIGLLIVLSASINFINLTTAQATRRAREVGIRKAFGGKRGQLIGQFMGETFLLTLLSVLVSLPLVGWLLPYLSRLFRLAISTDALFSPAVLLFLAGGTLIVSFLAGFYPALLMSGFEPVRALKGRVATTRRTGLDLGKGLIVFQLAVSQMLILGVMVIYNQMHYIKGKDLGFGRDARIILRVPDDEAKRGVFRERLASHSEVGGMTYSMGAPTKPGALNYTLVHQGRDLGEVRTIPIDGHYLDVFDIPIVAGERLAPRHETPPTSSVALINEAMVKELGYARPEEALGTLLTGETFEVRVIGVVQDFHQKSLRSTITPAVLLYAPRWIHHAGVEVRSHDLAATLSLVEAVYQEVFPNTFFSYYFLDDYLQSLYQAEERVFNMLKLFALVAILIGCLGLYGLISISSAQRMKEIGIRKVLGASATQLLLLLTKDLTRLALLACAVALPLAYLALQRWLENFAYHVEIGTFAVLMTGALGLLLTWLTIGYRSTKAALANPVESLKHE